ncbi:MAG: twin-arginine translocase subunit TatC [Armatimonadetes bacterium]|nr:twin-arginine translocase subunit TatC [Armatimonadota bacterium]
MSRDKARNSSGDPEEFRATLIEHLEELRTRLVRSITVIVICWVGGWFAEPWVYGTLHNIVGEAMKSSLPPGSNYVEAFNHFTEMFLFKLKLSFLIGLVVALPLVINQLWGFIAPGLTPAERRPVVRLAPISFLLFLMGATFCWFCLPAGIGWFVSYLADFPGASLFQEPGAMVLFLVKLILAFGLGFQLPIIVYGLGALGLLSAQTLSKYWRHGTVFVFFLSAILTPSNDPLTMLMMAIPLSILFMISVWAVKIVQRKKVKVIENPNFSEDDDVD